MYAMQATPDISELMNVFVHRVPDPMDKGRF